MYFASIFYWLHSRILCETFSQAPQVEVVLFQVFPEGFEKIFLLIYFIILPYIAGLIFLFFYVAEGSIELFLSINDESSFLLTWTIGYEIIAAIIILSIIKMAIGFANASRKPGIKKEFRRP